MGEESRKGHVFHIKRFLTKILKAYNKYAFYQNKIFPCWAMGIEKKSKFEMEVVKRVRAMREEHGLSQTDIAGIIGVTRGFVGHIESPNQAAVYSLNQLNALALEFECSPQDFLPKKGVE